MTPPRPAVDGTQPSLFAPPDPVDLSRWDSPPPRAEVPAGYGRIGDRLCTSRSVWPNYVRYLVYRIGGAGQLHMTRWFIDRERYERDPGSRYKVFLAGAGRGGCAGQKGFARLLADAGSFVAAQDWSDPTAWDDR